MGNESSKQVPIDNGLRDTSVDETISRLSRLQSITKSGNFSHLSQEDTLQTQLHVSYATIKPHCEKRKSSVLNVRNGVTGKYISGKICKIAARFWSEHIDKLNVSDKLEIGCDIFFKMLLTKNKSLKLILKTNLLENNSIEKTSLKYLDMMGWLIRHLMTDNIDFNGLLTKLGVFHQNMGITIEYFDPMLQAMHETFSYYFEDKYSLNVKYSIDEIFSLSAQIMTGQNLKYSLHLMAISKQFQYEDIPFLKNLDICLQSSIGKEYLYKYLAQTWCEEIAIFLQSLQLFKKAMSDKQRFIIARDIEKTSIQPTATFSLNLSFETRTNALNRMKKLEGKFSAKEKFQISTDFFQEIETEIHKLMMANHWKKFQQSMQSLQYKSFSVD